VLAPTLFGIFFWLLLDHAFGTSQEGIYLRSRSDGRLFNLSRLRAKTFTGKVVLRDMLSADDAAWKYLVLANTYTFDNIHLPSIFSVAVQVGAGE
jgi:hypothetical protein